MYAELRGMKLEVCTGPDEDFRDFYFAGEGDYIQNCIYDLLNDFAAVSVSIKVA